jgi:MbtH protein
MSCSIELARAWDQTLCDSLGKMADWTDGILKVVVNHEEQYSIWPTDRENAPGWRDAGKTGTKEECLSWIKEAWTDMRPASLRQTTRQA